MTIRVAKLHGISPVEWLADPTNVYVGRNVWLGSGPHANQSWGNSGFGNPHKFLRDDSFKVKNAKLFEYCRDLKKHLNEQFLLANEFKAMLSAASKGDLTLGCWCVDWYGEGRVPLCHAAWLARILQLMTEPKSKGVVVSAYGDIVEWTGASAHVGDWVILARPSNVIPA